MNSYLCTITFLAIIGLLTSSEMIQHHASSFEKQCYTQSRNLFAAAEEIRDLSQLDELRTNKNPQEEKIEPQEKDPSELKPRRSSPKYVKALGVNMARPPNNSRLNLYLLLHKDPHPKLPKEFSLYQVTARLMRDLYHNEPFFKNVPDAEYRILEKLIEKKEQTAHFTTPDQLSELNLGDETLQKVFYQMLKGTKNTPSILHYITFDKVEPTSPKRKINLLFADPRIIHAIFPAGNTATQLLMHRAQILDFIEYQEANKSKLSADASKGRRELTNQLKSALEEVLKNAGFKADKYEAHVFDYSLSKPGTILFIEDSKTRTITREKYIPSRIKN